MTNSEWFAATCKIFALDEERIALIMANQDIDPNVSADVKANKIALCKEFATMIPLANISEGGYSISYNWEAIKMWYRSTCASVGLVDTATRPKIRNRSDIW